MLLELARVEKARGNPEGMMAALLAASRGGETRAAELAREQLPDRYPYVYEFRKALELDPDKRRAPPRTGLSAARACRRRIQADAQTKPSRNSNVIVDASPDDYVAAAQLGLLYLAANQNALAMPILRNVLAHADAATANRVRMALKMPLVLEERRDADDLVHSIRACSASAVTRRVS